MCKFKKGDKVIIVKSEDRNPEVLKNGVTGIVLDLQFEPFVQFNIDANDCLHDACGIGEAGKCYSMDEDELELYSEYKQSNRHKLQQAIKATGFHAEKLSLATGFKKGYFSDYTSESRFNSRGDITEDRLNSLLTTLEFAERELLGFGDKTVDDNELSFEDYPLYDSTVDYPAEVKVNHNGEIKFATDVKIEEAEKALESFVLYHADKPKLSNFTKVGIITIVILLLILIVKNLVV